MLQLSRGAQRSLAEMMISPSAGSGGRHELSNKTMDYNHFLQMLTTARRNTSADAATQSTWEQRHLDNRKQHIYDEASELLIPLVEHVDKMMRLPPWWVEQPAPFPINAWTRMLLVQQQLIDLIDLLDADFLRSPRERRVRLSPLRYNKLAGWEDGPI